MTLPRQTGGGGKSTSEVIEDLAVDILGKLPQLYDMDKVSFYNLTYFVPTSETFCRINLYQLKSMADSKLMISTVINLDIIPLISKIDIFSINEMTLKLKIISHCAVKHIMLLPIKTIKSDL